jgi:hypothetical protein
MDTYSKRTAALLSASRSDDRSVLTREGTKMCVADLNRTGDLTIFSRTLHQLSYSDIEFSVILI